MKATGIVRRIDDLGRVVIPKEIRRTMRIREGDPLEIYTDNDGEVIFKKYSPIGELGNFSNDYATVLNKATALPVVVCDRDHVLVVSGTPQKEMVGRRVSSSLEDLMENRKTYNKMTDNFSFQPIEGIEKVAFTIYPIIASGDVCGAIMFLTSEHGTEAGDSEVKLISVAASFLGKQMEE